MTAEAVLPGKQPVFILLSKLWACSYEDARAREQALSADLRDQLSLAVNQLVRDPPETEEILLGQALGSELCGVAGDWLPIVRYCVARPDYLEVIGRIEQYEAQMVAATSATTA